MHDRQKTMLAQKLNEYEINNDFEMDVTLLLDNQTLHIDHLYAPGQGERVINHVISSVNKFNNNHKSDITTVRVRVGTEHPNGASGVKDFFKNQGFELLDDIVTGIDVRAEYTF